MTKIALSRLIALILMLGSFIFAAETDLAQNQSSHFVLKRDDTLTLYSVSESGDLQELFQFPANINLLIDHTEAEWTIPAIGDIVPSPDGQHIAFVAYHDETALALFVYSVSETELQQQSIPGLGALRWSPDSQSLLLTSPDIYYGLPVPVIRGAYLYELATGNFSQFVTTSNNSPGYVVWLPDNHHLIYTGRDIHVVDLHNLEERPLTDLIHQLPSDTFPAICNPVWSPFDQRLYYVVGCITGGGDADLQLNDLYSVDLNGNNRLELSLVTLKSQLRYGRIKDIIPNLTEGGVYIIAQMETDVIDENSNPLDYIQLLYVAPSSTHTLLFEQVTDIYAYYAQIKSILSPERGEIALTGYSGNQGEIGYVIDFDLSTQSLKLSNEYSGAVCAAQWVRETHLLYSLYSASCYPFAIPTSTWLLNVETGESIDITAGQSGTFYIIPASPIEPQITKLAPATSQKRAN